MKSVFYNLKLSISSKESQVQSVWCREARELGTVRAEPKTSEVLEGGAVSVVYISLDSRIMSAASSTRLEYFRIFAMTSAESRLNLAHALRFLAILGLLREKAIALAQKTMISPYRSNNAFSSDSVMHLYDVGQHELGKIRQHVGQLLVETGGLQKPEAARSGQRTHAPYDEPDGATKDGSYLAVHTRCPRGQCHKVVETKHNRHEGVECHVLFVRLSGLDGEKRLDFGGELVWTRDISQVHVDRGRLNVAFSQLSVELLYCCLLDGVGWAPCVPATVRCQPWGISWFGLDQTMADISTLRLCEP
ncbi:hypothetical protein VTI74DRAFT_2121 [Chaetomium olivicolor]